MNFNNFIYFTNDNIEINWKVYKRGIRPKLMYKKIIYV